MASEHEHHILLCFGLCFLNLIFAPLYNKNEPQMLEVSLLGVGTVLRLERDACVVNAQMMQASNECVRSPDLLSSIIDYTIRW